MGVCYSRAGWLDACSELSTSNSRGESPRWSAGTGEKGKLGALLYRRRGGRRRPRFSVTPDLFSARLHGLLGGLHSPGDFAIASFVGTDALAVSAAAASARNAFLLLQERDKAAAVEVFPPMIHIQAPDDDGEDVDDAGVQLDSPEDGDEIQELDHHEDSRSSEFSEFVLYDIDLGASYKAGVQTREPRSFFESCFPATGRWASVVDAAMTSACVPRNQPSPEPLELFEIRHEPQQRHVEASSETCSDAGHACIGCCGSSGRFSDSETCSEAGHACVGCCGSKGDASATSCTRTETRSSSDTVHIPHPTPSSLSPSHSLHYVEDERDADASPDTPMERPVQVVERVDSDLDSFFSFPSSPSAKFLEDHTSGHTMEEMEQDEGDELEGPRTRAGSPRGGNALSKGAFGSPFPVLDAKARPVLDKKLKLFSLDRANTAALAKKPGVTSDGVLTSSSDSYLDTSSGSLPRHRDVDHDWDDFSSDLFEIHDTALKSSSAHLSCLPLKKTFGCSSEVDSAPSHQSRALKYQVRGANAVRGADTRARILREQAMRKAKAEQVRVLPLGPGKQASHHGKGISVMVLSLLRRKQPESGTRRAVAATNPGLSGKSVASSSSTSDVVSVNVSSFELNGKSIKALSIRDVLERH